METLAIELAPYGIRVNMLTPGHHLTRLTAKIPPALEAKIVAEIPLRRIGNPDGCGSVAAFLLSDLLSGYTTGSEILVDGGLALRPLPFRTDQELLELNLPY
jgi:NAD(P)-dependent dehydrogenase (short-subunit alcohol dehydrogenase family)